MKRLEQIVLAQACEIATTAGAALAERVPHLDDARLIAAWGVAIDKIALRQGWARGGEAAAQPTGAADAVAWMVQMLDGGILTLSVSDADGTEQALEVKPKAGGWGQSPAGTR